MIVISGKQIKEVSSKGVVYLDENGAEQFIDFEACYQNYLERSTSPEAQQWSKEANNLSDDDLRNYIKVLRERKVVAGRHFDGYPDSKHPFIVFQTEPPIRFEFATRDEFEEVRYAIRKAGWQTFDMA